MLNLAILATKETSIISLHSPSQSPRALAMYDQRPHHPPRWPIRHLFGAMACTPPAPPLSMQYPHSTPNCHSCPMEPYHQHPRRWSDQRRAPPLQSHNNIQCALSPLTRKISNWVIPRHHPRFGIGTTHPLKKKKRHTAPGRWDASLCCRIHVLPGQVSPRSLPCRSD